MASYRTYTPWSKSSSSSYGGTTGSGSSGAKSSDGSAGGTTTTPQYEGYRRRYGGDNTSTSNSSSTYRPPPTSYRAPYATTYGRDRSSERSYSRERSSERTEPLISKYINYLPKDGKQKEEQSIIDKYSNKKENDRMSIKDKYLSNKESERQALIDKYSYGTYPGRKDKENDLISNITSYSGRPLSRRNSRGSRDPSPEIDFDKGKSLYSTGSAGSLPSYRMFGRSSSYSRSNSRDIGSESGSSAASTPATTPIHAPSSLRFSSSTRYMPVTRSPVSEKTPSTFGLGSGYSSLRRRTSTEELRTELQPPPAPPPSSSPAITPSSPTKPYLPNFVPQIKTENSPKAPTSSDEEDSEEESEEESDPPPTIFITLVTRATSPTAPSSSSYLRSRRADLARTLERTVPKPTKKPKMIDKEIQSDRGDDTSRTSRYGGATRSAASPWSSYLDRYSSPASRYTSRYSSYGTNKEKDADASSSTGEQGTSPTESSSKSTDNSRSETTSTPSKDLTSMRTRSASDGGVIEKNSKISEKSISASNENVNSKDTSSGETKSAPLSRVTSSKNILGKPMVKTDNSQTEASGSLQSKSSSATSLTSKSSSVASVPDIVLPKTPPICPSPTKIIPKQPSSNAVSKVSPLPPAPPKSDSLKSSASLHSVHQLSVANKDFRKSTLNMDLPNGTDAESLNAIQEKKRKTAKLVKKIKKSPSVSSAESEPTSVHSAPPVANGTPKISPCLKTSNSLSKLAPTVKFLDVSKSSKESSPNTQSTKEIKLNSPSKSQVCHSSSSSESSSSESSSESDSSSDAEDERTTSRSSATNIRRRRSPTASKILISTRPSSADESSLSADKPPRPPASPRVHQKTEEAKSFLMRALAPVTNLFRNKQQDSEGTENSSCDMSEGLKRTGSTQSLTKLKSSDKEDSSKSESSMKKSKMGIKRVESGELPWWLDENAEVPEGIVRVKSSKSIAKLAETLADLQKSDTENKFSYKIIRQESGEKAWWLDSNPNIPEGVQRIKSSSSVNSKKGSDSDSKKSDTKSASSAQTNHSKNDNEVYTLYKIRHIDSEDKPWWLSSNGDIPEGVIRMESKSSINSSKSKSNKDKTKSSSTSEESSEEESSESTNDKKKQDTPTKTRGSLTNTPKFPLSLPEEKVKPDSEKHHLDQSGRTSPYDNVQTRDTKEKAKPSRPRPKNLPLFIGNHTNIDEILGSAATLVDPVMGVSRLKRGVLAKECDTEDDELDDLEEIDPSQVKIHDSGPQKANAQRLGETADSLKGKTPAGMIKLDDTALQLYKDGDYGAYLDLEASINEQHEEFEGFHSNRKNSIVLRTQLSVRVHTIIEKLLNSEGRELRRALFSLKQIFQEDKDLVHEFVQNDGLACLIKVGSEADQNYQNYILRALGQVMLYVDGMNGVMEHNQTVQWLYTLIASKFRLVVKTALKLLLVFVEYVETNCLLLIKAITAVDTAQGVLPWNNIVKLLKDYDAADTELLIYAMTLVNKTLNGVPDQDTYYDQVDALEEQGIEGVVQKYMSKQGTDLDLLRQFQIYEAVLHHEDGEEKGTPLKQLDETIRKTLRQRKALTDSMPSSERRKSRRHSTGTSPLSTALHISQNKNSTTNTTTGGGDDDETGSSSSRSSPCPGDSPGMQLNGTHRDNKTVGDVGVTPALRRRRERAERQRSFIREQQETAATLRANLGNSEENIEDENEKYSNNSHKIPNGTLDSTSNKFQLNRVSSRKDLTPIMNAVNKMYGNEVPNDTEGTVITENGNENGEFSERKMLLQLKRENTVKDLTQKLASQNIIQSPVEDSKVINRIGDMTGLISKAKEGLAKSKSKADVLKSPTGTDIPKIIEVKKSETELHWDELVSSLKRPLSLCDLDFTDLKSEDEIDILSPAHVSNGIPPPPPPVPLAPGLSPSKNGGIAPPPPPPVSRFGNTAPPPPAFGVSLRNQRNLSSNDTNTIKNSSSPKKTKKTVKLFWKEVRDDPIILAKLQKTGMIWDELNPVSVDTQKLEHLFESRAKDLITKEKQQEMNKNKEIIVLDHKRSNAINIGMTKLPPPRSIKTAIMKMDATIMNREGIEKLLTMLPTEEERTKIQEAQMANPDLPLGSAEQFLLTLASISELPARLKLWAFKLDFENSEKEVAEPLMDLKQGIETLKANKTFRGILSTLLSIGIFLNGTEVKGFQIEYLAKVPEVKDTVHKHSLLHHLCHMVMEKFPDSSDLYSEIGAVTRASKVDFDELAANIVKMEQECKASWDHLKVIAKHDGPTMKVKMSDFLSDCAERIIVLGIVHRRVMNRFHKFLLWLGIPLHRVQDMKPNEFCRIVSEFALEYRTTRERVLQQLEKKANHRERNKTRGKMITEVGKFRSKEDRADAELRQLLGSDISDAESLHGTLTWRRQRKELGRTHTGTLIRDEGINGHLTDGDDEILESLVKTATKAPTSRTTPRERKRTRNADRKSLKRSRTRENNVMEGCRESP